MCIFCAFAVISSPLLCSCVRSSSSCHQWWWSEILGMRWVPQLLSEVSSIWLYHKFLIFFHSICIDWFHWGTGRILSTSLNYIYAFLKSPGRSSCGLCWMTIIFLILLTEAAEFHRNINLHWCGSTFLLYLLKDTYATDVFSVCISSCFLYLLEFLPMPLFHV